MPLHFQVYADFSFIKGKPQLISTAIYTTLTACTDIVFCPNEKSPLTISRILPTLKNAYSYIAYLHGVYPHSPAPPPVFDSGQQDFFMEVSS